MILPTSWLPPIAYIAECIHADEIVIESRETYPKQTFRNRCAIFGPNGRQILTVPVHKPGGDHTPTGDIRIDNSIPWQKLHWRSIETAYNNSPFFLYYKDEFEIFFQKKYDRLVELNREILETIFKILRINKNISFTDQFLPEEYPPFFHPIVNKHYKPSIPSYTQVFSPEKGFQSNLSILDCLFNLGNDAFSYCSAL